MWCPCWVSSLKRGETSQEVSSPFNKDTTFIAVHSRFLIMCRNLGSIFSQWMIVYLWFMIANNMVFHIIPLYLFHPGGSTGLFDLWKLFAPIVWIEPWKMANKVDKHCTDCTEFADILGQGNANGNCKYLSVMINMYQFLVLDGSGPCGCHQLFLFLLDK